MAIYHFHVTQVSRGKGQSAIAAAAYRAGERLQDHYYGEYADYTAKGGVVYTEIIAPDYVSESFRDKETLWNEVERVEKHPKAQLAYSFDFALMNEFSMEENIILAKRFIKENFIAMERGRKIYRDSVSLPGLLMLLTSCHLTGVEIVDFYLLCATHLKQRYIFWKMKQNPVLTLNRCGRR